MEKGDTQLIMSLALVMLGSLFFFVGIGTEKWVLDDAKNQTYHYGLWDKCVELNGNSECTVIKPGSSKAYFEFTRVMECISLVVYVVTLITCFTADDRDPSESCRICCRRYFHVVLAFSASGLSFLVLAVFSTGYDDDDWFTDPSLGFSYWLTFVGWAGMTSGAVMRVVFILWPSRPKLLVRRSSLQVPAAPASRTARVRHDDKLGSDALPKSMRPKRPTSGQKVTPYDSDMNVSEISNYSDHNSFTSNYNENRTASGEREKKKKKSAIRRFFGFFSSKKAKVKKSMAEVGDTAKATAQRFGRKGVRWTDEDPEDDIAVIGGNVPAATAPAATSIVTNGVATATTSPRKPSILKKTSSFTNSSIDSESLPPLTMENIPPIPHVNDSDFDTNNSSGEEYGSDRHRRHLHRRRRDSGRSSRRKKNKRRSGVPVERFVGYNIPPIPDALELSPESLDLYDKYVTEYGNKEIADGGAGEQEEAKAADLLTMSTGIWQLNYEQAVGVDDLTARVVSPAPPVFLPPRAAPTEADELRYATAFRHKVKEQIQQKR